MENITPPKLKIRKGAVERRAKQIIEAAGGTFISISWSKMTVHFLTPKGQKKVDSLYFPHQ